MDYLFSLQQTLQYIFLFLNSIEFAISLIIITIIYNILIYLLKNRRLARTYQRHKEKYEVRLDTLKDIPLVTIIVPAWNEGNFFKECLESITKLKYPKLNVIVNAGGNQKTLEIANSYKTKENFRIIYQEGGGKIKALNECLTLISEGLVYMVDADVLFTDEILLRIIYPLVNLDEYVSISEYRPLPSQQKNDFVIYLKKTHHSYYKSKFQRYYHALSGANSCVKYEVIDKIGTFSESSFIAEDLSRGMDILNIGYRIQMVADDRSLIYSYVAEKMKVFFHQRTRWMQNSLFENKTNQVKYLCLFLFSLYLVLSPVFFLVNYGLFFLGIFFFVNLYLSKIRRILTYNIARPNITKELEESIWFYLKISLYLLLEIIINLYVLVDFIFFRQNFEKRRNLVVNGISNGVS